MKFMRLYAGSDGQSHFEEFDKAKAAPFLNDTKAATSYLIRDDFAPHIVNFHCAPRRRFVITLRGSVKIGLGDGSNETFQPGDIFLAEDTTGQGHTATPTNWIRLYVNLD
ncbi:MAG: hypothetical protein FJ145_17070 [Deltaproteobacteria bacterium]|nr:hypothetical protein [Deltaproteobacteria bacterium]